MAKWFHVCRSTHERCNKRSNGSFFKPTRLLYIKPKIIRLVEGHNLKPTAAYATLSHCWGSDPIELRYSLTTTRAEEFRSGILMRKLAPNFIDAIHVARQLSIDYLWIDCLCIIQDSAEDWLNEAGLMTEVYKNSSVTIAATAFGDGKAGLFIYRDPNVTDPVQCYLQDAITYSQSHQNPKGAWYLLMDAINPWTTIESSPLMRRAWVLQERLLSTRIIHFFHEQIYWECSDLCACESQPSGFLSDSPKSVLQAYRNGMVSVP